MKKVPVELERVVTTPNKLDMKPGVLYYSEKWGQIDHLCLCGCGERAPIPIAPYWAGGWAISEHNGKVSLTPSLLHRFACKSHYVITNGIANFV